jgi:ribosomal protein S18 acetylase RimI-like enzyme
MAIVSDISGHEAEYLTLAGRAWEPYAAFVYADLALAARVDQLLFSHDVGDVARQFGRIWLEKGRVLGAMVWIPGCELAVVRLKAAVVLRRTGILADPEIARRIRLAGQTLARVTDDVLYMNRLAVAEAARGMGIASAFMAAAETYARRLRARRLLFEVSPLHANAIRLYERLGYTTVVVREVYDEISQRHLAYHHMTKAVDGPSTS